MTRATIAPLNDEARDLAGRNYPLAIHISRQCGRAGSSRRDLAYDSAIDGLFAAARRHGRPQDPTRVAPFGAFAVLCMRRQIGQDAVKALHRADMLHRAEPIEEVDDSWSIPAPDDPPDRRPDEDAADFERLIAPVDREYRDVLRMRYRDGLALAQIGGRLGCSVPAARECLLRALDIFHDMTRAGRITLP